MLEQIVKIHKNVEDMSITAIGTKYQILLCTSPYAAIIVQCHVATIRTTIAISKANLFPNSTLPAALLAVGTGAVGDAVDPDALLVLLCEVVAVAEEVGKVNELVSVRRVVGSADDATEDKLETFELAADNAEDATEDAADDALDATELTALDAEASADEPADEMLEA